MKAINTKRLHRTAGGALFAALAASLLLAGCGLTATDDDDDGDNGVIGSLAVTQEKDLTAIVGGSEPNAVELKLTLTDTTFAGKSTKDDNLAGYVVVAAGEDKADTVTPKNTIWGTSDEATVIADIPVTKIGESGTISVTLEGAALKSRRALSATAGKYNTVGAATTGDALTPAPGTASEKTYKITLTGLTFTDAAKAAPANYITVRDDTGKDTYLTVSNSSATATDTELTVTVSGAAAVDESESGSLVFTLTAGAVALNGTAYTGSITCVSDIAYSIDGATAALSGEGATGTQQGYGAEEPKFTTKALTVTLTNGHFPVAGTAGYTANEGSDGEAASVTYTGDDGVITSMLEVSDKNWLDNLDENDLGSIEIHNFTVAEDQKSATFTVTAYTAVEFTSDDDAFTGELSLTAGGLGNTEKALSIALAQTVAYAVGYNPGDHYAQPTTAQVVAATNKTVADNIGVTVLTFDTINGHSLASALSAGSTLSVTSAKIGITDESEGTDLTVTVLEDVAAGATAIPVKLSGADITGKISIVLPASLVAGSDVDVPFTRKDCKHIAVFKFNEDYSGSDVNWGAFVNTYGTEPLRGKTYLSNGNVVCEGDMATGDTKGGGLSGVFFSSRTAVPNDKNTNACSENKLYDLEDGTDFAFVFDVQFVKDSNGNGGPATFVISNANGAGLNTGNNPQSGTLTVANCLVYLQQDAQNGDSWTINGKEKATIAMSSWYTVTITRVGTVTHVTIAKRADGTVAFDGDLELPSDKGGLGEVMYAVRIAQGRKTLYFDNAMVYSLSGK